MERTVPIASISVNRTLEPGDDVTELADHIRDSGLVIPVLVNQNYELIDGLRRLEALRMLGFTAVHVTPVTLFGPAATWIQRAREHGVLAKPLSPRRVWHLYSMCQPLINVSRSQAQRGTKHGKGAHVNGRERFIEATGIRGESWLQAVVQTYRMTLEQSARGELARQAAALVDRGDLSAYGAPEWIKRRYNAGNITEAEDQLALLQNTAHTLNGIAFGFKRLAELHQDVTTEQLTPILKDFRTFRRTLHQLIHTLEKDKDS